MEYESIIKPPKSRQLKSGRVTLDPDESVGKHCTTDREELLVVLLGSVLVIAQGEEILLHAGQTRFIPMGVEHDVTNHTTKPAQYIYIVTPCKD